MTGKYFEESGGGIARVTFRVRCESLGYGEAVLLYPDDESTRVSIEIETEIETKCRCRCRCGCTQSINQSIDDSMKQINPFNISHTF
jgi:hypothetical protein